MTLKNNYHIMTLNENDTNSEPYSVCPSTVIFDSTELKIPSQYGRCFTQAFLDREQQQVWKQHGNI